MRDCFKGARKSKISGKGRIRIHEIVLLLVRNLASLRFSNILIVSHTNHNHFDIYFIYILKSVESVESVEK